MLLAGLVFKNCLYGYKTKSSLLIIMIAAVSHYLLNQSNNTAESIDVETLPNLDRPPKDLEGLITRMECDDRTFGETH